MTARDIGSSDEADLSFLASPEQVCDWRKVLGYDAAVGTGLLEALPGTAPNLSASLGLDEQAVRALLDVLALWGLVALGPDGTYEIGPAVPTAEESAVLRHHARALRQWGSWCSEQPQNAGTGSFSIPLFLKALAPGARRSAGAVVDACLRTATNARSVLDVGGGHGEYALEFARRGLTVTLQDRPGVIQVLENDPRVAEAEISLFAGDFFELLPDGPFDVVFCAGVTDSYGGERNRELFGRLRSVLATDGWLTLMSFLRGHHPAAVLFAASVAAMGSRGDTHSRDEYGEWLADSGFQLASVADVEDGRHTLLFAAPSS